MKIKITRVVVATSVALGMLFAGASAALAQREPGGLTISPFLYERQMDKGQSLQEQIELINNNPYPTKIDSLVKDFTSNGVDGSPVFYNAGEGDPAYSLASWINIQEKDTFQLAPGDHKIIHFTITAPQDADNGGHYATILFNFQQINQQGTAVATAQQIGANILVKLGKANEDGAIHSFATEKSFYEYPPVNFITIFKNTGNVHTKPRGKITITNSFGNKVAYLRINENANNVLPNSQRNFKSTWEEKFGFGRYTAIAEVTFGDNGALVTAQTTFWVIPWKTTLIVIIVLFIAILLLVLITKRYNRWVIKQAQMMSAPARPARKTNGTKKKSASKK